jgi:hypothetical protein
MNEQLSYPYELLQRIVDLFPVADKAGLNRTYIFACQHILEPQQRMFKYLVDIGIPKENIFILGKAYSTNEQVLKEIQDFGLNASQPDFDSRISFDEQHKVHCSNMFDKFQKTVVGRARVIVLDDGAGLLSVFNDNFDRIDKGIEIAGIEQTSSGFRRLESEILKFPIINVARSDIKLSKESGFIAELCNQRISDYLMRNNLLKNRFLVVGLGPIGQAIVDLLQTGNNVVFGFDTILGHQNLIGKILELKPNVIIGATGSTILSKDDILTINSLGYKIHLISVSSSDREFAITEFRAGYILKIHSDVQFENVTFVNNGFPITFTGNRYEGYIEGIERTICLLLGSVLSLLEFKTLSKIPKHFIEVPEKVTNIL